MSDNNINLLSAIKYITDYEAEFKELKQSLIAFNKWDTNQDKTEIAQSITQRVFNGKPVYLCDSLMWKWFCKFNNITNDSWTNNIEKYFNINQSTITATGEQLREYSKSLMGVINNNTQQTSANTAQQTNLPLYIQVLKNSGYSLCDDRNSIAGKTSQKTNLINWLKGQCTEALPKDCKYTSNSCLVNAEVLKSNNIDYQTADIWSIRVNKVHEDTKFRLFIRETDISFNIIIKLPLGLEEFDFTSNKAQIEIKRLLNLFTNNDKTKGDTYSCSLIGEIAIKSIGYMFQIDCNYNGVFIVLSKDLIKFKNSNYLVSDYIDACQGITNKFMGFSDDLCLGNKIVFGVTPGKLESVVLHTSAPNQLNGCLMSGGAGSGKSAFLDSLLVQGLALDNRDYGKLPNGTRLNNQGNGAVVLLDAKANEWVKPWKNIINSMGYVFYGFDGCMVDQSLLRYVNPKTKQSSNINFDIPEYVLGMCFLSALRYIIREKYGLIGAKDVVTYNNATQDNKLPRILILCDELNTIQSTITTKPFGKIYNKFFMANDTRTASYHWVLAGQNLKARVVSNQDQVNYPYRVMGTLDKESYDYHGVTIDKAVEAYESKTEKGSIMSQGMFYFGKKGNTKVIKGMYLPDDNQSRQSALSKISLSGLNDLNNLVQWGIQNTPHLLKDNMLNNLYPNNNFVITALYITGVIDQNQFNTLSSYVLGEEQSQGDYDEQQQQTEQQTQHNQEQFAFNLNEPEQQSLQQQQQIQQPQQESLFDNIDFSGYNIEDENTQHNQQTQQAQQQTAQQKVNEPLNLFDNIDFSGYRVEVEPSNSSIFDNVHNDNLNDIDYIETNNQISYKSKSNITSRLSNILNHSPVALKRYGKGLFGDIIKDGIGYFGNKHNINKLTIIQNDIWLNDRYINNTDCTEDIRNIVTMKEISKLLPSLTYIILDTSIMSAFYSELGDSAIQKIFKLNKYLQHLTIQKTNNQTIEIDRQDIEVNPGIRDDESENKDRLTKACNKSSKRRFEFTGLTSKIYGFNLVSDSMGRAKDNIWYSGGGKIHPLKAMGWTALGLSTLAVTGGFSLIARGTEGLINKIRGV